MKWPLPLRCVVLPTLAGKTTTTSCIRPLSVRLSDRTPLVSTSSLARSLGTNCHTSCIRRKDFSTCRIRLFGAHWQGVYIGTHSCGRGFTSLSTADGDHTGSRHSRYPLPLLLLAFSLPWRKNKDEDEVKVDPVVMALKRGVLATQKQQYTEAQEFFHEALTLGEQQHKQQIINDSQFLLMRINIFGLMADSAMKASDFANAEKLYKETMKLCLAAGRHDGDPAIIELSIKLASMYAMQSRDEEAGLGFDYCLEATEKLLQQAGGVTQADTNLLALYGLTCQSYARFLMKLKKYDRAIELYTQSLDVAKEVYGMDHPQALVVLNDIASAHVISGKHSEGIRYYSEAAQRASGMENMDDSLVAFHYNLGEACILAKDYEKARRHCELSRKFAQKVQNPALIRMAEQCISDVKESKKTKDNS